MTEARIRVAIDADKVGLDRGLRAAEGSAQSFASRIRQVAGAIAGAFAAREIARFALSSMEAAYNVDKLSRAIGTSASSMQSLQLLASRNASSAEAMVIGLERIKKAQDRAIAGGQQSKELIEAFREFGIIGDQIATMAPDRIFEIMARRLTDATITAKEGAAANYILGRGYQNLRATMQALVEEGGLDSLNKKLRETNQILGDEQVAALARANEAWLKLSTQIKVALQNALVWIGSNLIAKPAAFLGALTGGASLQEAVEIAGQTWREMAKPRPATTGPRSFTGIAQAATPTAQPDFSKITVDAPRAANALAQIGGKLGMQASLDRSIAQRQLAELEEIRRVQEENEKRLAKIEEHTANLED